MQRSDAPITDTPAADLSDFAYQRPRYRVAALITFLMVLAWFNRFCQDDAFISFVYARNLALGKGLVWSTGERIQGFTNFLWTLLVAGAIRLDIDPVRFSQWAGLACFLGVLMMLYGMCRRLFGKQSAAMVAILLTGTNYTVSCYATGGLETSLVTMLVVACLALLCAHFDRMTFGGALALSLASVAAVLTRLDTVLLVGPIVCIAGWRTIKTSARVGRPVMLLALVLPGLMIFAGWAAWTMHYYGDLLPNTFYAKAGNASIRTGLTYVAMFFSAYSLAGLLLPTAAFAIWKWRQGSRSGSNLMILILGVLSLLWIGYIVSVGGDFMEHRFFVPVVPLLMIIITWFIYEVTPNVLARASFVAVVLTSSLLHPCLFVESKGVESVRALKSHLYKDRWIEIGRQLQRLFPGGAVSLAVAPAGAIPYYSELPSIDMLGLNDKWVARHGTVFGTRPGHQRIATYEYLVSRGVNLIIGHPCSIKTNDPPAAVELETWNDCSSSLRDYSAIPEKAEFLAIPVDEELSIIVLYLTAHPEVDRLARMRAWRRWPVVAPGAHGRQGSTSSSDSAR